MLKLFSVAFDFLCVSIFKLTQGLCIFFLSLKKILVPLWIKLLILLNMSLFTLFPLLSLIENQFFVFSLLILLFQIRNSVFRHLSFDIFTFFLAGMSVLFKYLTIIIKMKVNTKCEAYFNLHKVLYVISVWFLTKYVLLRLFIHWNKNVYKNSKYY